MKALILNAGIGKRMGTLSENMPKCMMEVSECDTILSRQLAKLYKAGISDIIITTGQYDEIIKDYCASLDIPMKYEFVYNPLYATTNYIYSIYLAKDFLNDDILLLHGDLVFDELVLKYVMENDDSCMTISTIEDLPEKDFKAVIQEGRIKKVGVEFFENAFAAQPFYYLKKEDLKIWLNRIIVFCEKDEISCYAEKALNEITDDCKIVPMDIGNILCREIDTKEDLMIVREKLKTVEQKTVYMSFSTDIIHGGHIEIIRKASKLGKLIIGVLSDEIVSSYKRFPLLSFLERKELILNIKGVYHVELQDSLSYTKNLKFFKPDIVVHGDDWRDGFQKNIREEVICNLNEWGGQLVEFPYSKNEAYIALEKQSREQLSIPDVRRGRLKKLLRMKKTLNIIEAHNGITGLIAEKTTVLQEGKSYQFDGMWVSSLCDSTAKGKPDIELVDMSSRLRTIDDIMEVTTKPIILDGDTGGLIEHFVYNIRTLERIGVSAIIIEDKIGLKKNSLFGTEVDQEQDTIENFSAKIKAGKRAQKTKEFMVIARIESLILDKGMEDALKRAFAYVGAGADGIMIHSRKKEPNEIFEFCQKFRQINHDTCLVVVPTTFNTVTEEELSSYGVNIVIYANQLIRSGFPAMQKTAETILINHRAKEADELCMPIKDIIRLIPEDL